MVRKVTAADTLEMSVDERLELVGDIWDSMSAAPGSLELDEEERAELDRRLEAYRQDPSAGEPWEVVRDRIQRQRRRR